MLQADWITLVRRLVADPVALPTLEQQADPPQATDPPPRWSRAEILAAAEGELARLLVQVPRIFQTGTAYRHLSQPPELPDNDAFDMATLGNQPLPEVLARLVTAALLADVVDAGAATAADNHAARAAALLEGWTHAV